MKLQNEQIQYIEFLSEDFTVIKDFYSSCFNWKFTDYGEDYTAFEGKYVDGGFAKGEVQKGSILVVLFSDDIMQTKMKIIEAGGKIVQDIFSFPGGKRFQFADPDGNELAVWTQ